MYKILFIDEQREDSENFLNYIEENDGEKKFEVIFMLPLADINEMIGEVLALRLDAIVIDYFLNEYKTEIKYNVPYNGVTLMEEILKIREDFPCFIMTSFDDNAIKESHDVNSVYIKGILHGDEKKTAAKSTFIERVENQIIHYRKNIRNVENELNNLLEKSKTQKLNAVEEEKLLDLEAILERAIHAPSKIPTKLKETNNLVALHKLITETDDFLKQLKDSKKND
jgi:hypothetical protein